MSPSSVCLETQQSLRARRRQGEKVTGHLVRIDSSSPPRRDKEDILQTKQNTRCSSHFFHIHPGAFSKRHREELLPVFPPKWKELSTIITTFSTKSWALCTGKGNNDHVLFCGDSLILPLRLDAVTPGGMLWNVNWGGLSVTLKRQWVLTRAHKVSIHCLSVALISYR